MKFMIPLIPVTKKNSQRIIINRATGSPRIIPSPQYQKYEADAAQYIPKLSEPIEEPVQVTCCFYMPTRRRVDLTNLLEAIDDVLVKSGVLKDDDYTVIASHDGSRVYYDKKQPRTEVVISSFT